jgi:cobalt-zinc-cadmium efflux system membrane fusion protein
MNRPLLLKTTFLLLAGIFAVGCERTVTAHGPGADGTGPVPAKIESDFDSTNFRVDHPERFPVAAAGEHTTAPELNVTGVVSPDVSRQVPVPSLATGRVVEIDVRLGDTVKKGQLLFKVRSTDIAGAYSDYQKAIKNEQLAVKNEQLAKIQLDRATLLFEDGAIPKSASETAQNNRASAQTALENARIDVQTATEHLKMLGGDPNRASGTGIIEVYSPVSGVITDQQITDQSGVQALTPPNPLTISDLSHVWIICDVYENNLSQVHVGEYADIHLTAFPDRVLRARIANILPILDPNLRTAKVRLEIENAGILPFGMFVTATFHGSTAERRATVPAAAILHLHDREWVYTPSGNGAFRRVEVTGGAVLPNNFQEIVSGIKPGEQVVVNALVFQNTVEQ